MQVQTDPSQHLWKMSLGREQCHTKPMLCVHTEPTAGKESSGVSIASWPLRRTCEMYSIRAGQFRCSRAVSLTCRGALADGEPWRGAGRGAAGQGVGHCEADTGINTPPQAAFFSPCCSQFHVVKIAQPFPYLCSLPGCVTSSACPFIHRFCPVSSLM